MNKKYKPSKIAIRALEILENTSYSETMTATTFGRLLWPGHQMHRITKNTGNGACRGKAGWLLAGSYLNRLIKKGLVRKRFSNNSQPLFYISFSGKEILSNRKAA